MLDKVRRRRCLGGGSFNRGVTDFGGSEQNDLAETFAEPLSRINPRRIVEQRATWTPSAAPPVPLLRKPRTNS